MSDAKTSLSGPGQGGWGVAPQTNQVSHIWFILLLIFPFPHKINQSLNAYKKENF